MTQGPPTTTRGPAVDPARDPKRPFARSAFSHLARTHALGIAGDALFAIALAGSVFFNLDFDSARWRVALYLVLTIAPFAVAAPLIGPALDRIPGGRRWVIVGSMAARALLCALVIRHLDSLWFYPEAFLMLVLGKVYTISKSAVVPTTVRSDTELVEANSKLTVLSAIVVVIAVIPGGILLKVTDGSHWTLGLAAIAFAVATVFALQLPATQVAVEPADERERMELRSAAIFQASIAMGLIRAIVGFLVFMLAFDFKNTEAPVWHLGVAAAAAQLGFFLGAILAPRLRRLVVEERILIGNLVVIVVGALLSVAIGGLVAAALLSMVVGVTACASKQAFDAIIQRDAPDANRGRSFARFETRFQLYWVIGALVPIIIPIPAELGFLLVGLLAAVALGWYLWGRWRISHGHIPTRRLGVAGLRRRLTGGTAAVVAGGDQPAEPAADVTEVQPIPPPPSPSEGARRWARREAPAADEWEPPAGFVSHRLGEPDPPEPPAPVPGGPLFSVPPPPPPPPPVAPATSPAPVGQAPGPDADPRPVVVQPTLPLGETFDYPEPRWRDDTAVDHPAGGDAAVDDPAADTPRADASAAPISAADISAADRPTTSARPVTGEPADVPGADDPTLTG